MLLLRRLGSLLVLLEEGECLVPLYSRLQNIKLPVGVYKHCSMLRGRKEGAMTRKYTWNIFETETGGTRLTYNRLFGFLLGATTSGAGMYYYVIDEYRVSNQLLTEDIYVRSYTRPHYTSGCNILGAVTIIR
jgi:hypothetical protein